MKKIISFILTILITLLCFGNTAFAANLTVGGGAGGGGASGGASVITPPTHPEVGTTDSEVEISKGKVTVDGKTVTINISFTKSREIKSLMLYDLDYDNDLLEFVSGKVVASPTPDISDVDENGEIVFAYKENTEVKGKIATLTFKSKSKTGTSDIDCDIIAKKIEDGEEVRIRNFDIEMGSVTVNPKSSTGGGGGGGASSYTVKFETNGGSKVDSVSTTGSAISEPTAPTRDGYTFDGWYTDKELTTAYEFSSKVTKTFTLYAKWLETEIPDETTGWKNPFKDVKENDWYFETVKTTVEMGIMNGVSNTEFGPDTNVTRGMFVTVLYRMENEPAVNRSIPFEDVNANEYFANAVIWAQQNNIVSGVTETEFVPNANITREQMATILFRYAQYNEMDAVTLEENLGQFVDNSEISEYAVTALNWTVSNDVMSGKGDGILDPKGNATRAEAAAVLIRMIQ